MAEMKWFIDAAKKLQAKGVKEISVVSETITTHEYESKTLAKAFTEITGITVKHDLIQEGDVVEKLQTSMQSGKSIYDGWINDSDLIGTHWRYGKRTEVLTDWMQGEGKEQTESGLARLHRPSFTTAPDGSSTSCPTSSSPTSTGSAHDLVHAPGPEGRFKASTATTWACR
jgi:glycerol transport system substrate-binding protein